jgi:hypothetical protein
MPRKVEQKYLSMGAPVLSLEPQQINWNHFMRFFKSALTTPIIIAAARAALAAAEEAPIAAGMGEGLLIAAGVVLGVITISSIVGCIGCCLCCGKNPVCCGDRANATAEELRPVSPMKTV